MPNAFIKKVSETDNFPINKLEAIWNKAKSYASENLKDSNEVDYRMVMYLFKKIYLRANPNSKYYKNKKRLTESIDLNLLKDLQIHIVKMP
jgi:hypothetical protein